MNRSSSRQVLECVRAAALWIRQDAPRPNAGSNVLSAGHLSSKAALCAALQDAPAPLPRLRLRQVLECVRAAALWMARRAPSRGPLPPPRVSSKVVPGPRGFTLLEVLIAVTAFAIVLAAINGVYYGALRLRNRTTSGLEQALPLERATTVIRRDLANIVLPGGTLSGPFQTGSTSNAMVGQSSPAFYTSTGTIDETSPWAEVERVSYLLLDSTNRANGKDLIRSVSRNLLPAVQEESEQQWLMTGLQQMAFLYYDGSQWRDSWDSTTPDLATGLSNALPKAIKVQIQLLSESTGRSRERETPIELVVPITVQARTNQTQTTPGGQP